MAAEADGNVAAGRVFPTLQSYGNKKKPYDKLFEAELLLTPVDSETKPMIRIRDLRRPGRVQTRAIENIAFSNADLTSNQMVPIDHNMPYRVEVVRPGSSVSFDADDLATRICMLAAGKLRVVVGDDELFVMGPNGMFKVKRGTSFAVENRLDIDAYLHILPLHNAAEAG